MAFIKITNPSNQKPYLINVDHITETEDYIHTFEAPDKVHTLIKMAQAESK